MKVARRALRLSLALRERAGVRDTVMVAATYIFRDGADAMAVSTVLSSQVNQQVAPSLRRRPEEPMLPSEPVLRTAENQQKLCVTSPFWGDASPQEVVTDPRPLTPPLTRLVPPRAHMYF
jgi:hypothetical protein